MNTKLNSIITFATGAILGSLVTWKCLEKKYKQIAQEEIDSMREYYRNKDFTVKDIVKAAVDEGLNVDISMVDREKYLDSESERCEKLRKEVTTGESIDIPIPQEYADLTSQYTSKEVNPMEDRPYVISPEEYGDIDGYECISLNYYADGVVADDSDNIIENVEYVIGEDSLDHFGEYEEDCVFVRNDTTRCDYEILRDTRNFEDIMNGNEE